MARQCERPGCSAPAAVAYGMSSASLLAWLERVPDDGGIGRLGVVCRRHADAMVVPRGWTLDDRRESRPRLFRVPETSSPPADPRSTTSDVATPMRPTVARRPTGSAGSAGPDSDQLELSLTVGAIRPLGVTPVDETRAMPWRFEFDQSDDLDGLLRTDSPLLSRAFRGVQRTET